MDGLARGRDCGCGCSKHPCAGCKRAGNNSLGCGPGGCDCGGCCKGLSGGQFLVAGQPYRKVKVAHRVRRILEKYVREKSAKKEPFYITAELNSEVLYGVPADHGMGFLQFLVAAFAAIAHIAPAIANIAGAIGAVKAVSGGSSSAKPDPAATAQALTPDILAALQARGIMLPSSIAPQVVHAGLLDSLSPENQQLLLFGGLGLIALLLLR